MSCDTPPPPGSALWTVATRVSTPMADMIYIALLITTAARTKMATLSAGLQLASVNLAAGNRQLLFLLSGYFGYLLISSPGYLSNVYCL